MDRPTSLRNTMLCLVVAMTATSALLGWMDPSTTSPALPPSPSVFLPIARAAVERADGQTELQWSTIDVLAGPAQSVTDSEGGPTFLAARSSQRLVEDDTESDCHFRVDRNGVPFATRYWIEQRSLEQTPETIRIQIDRLENDERMTRAQWFCVRALALALSELDHTEPVMASPLDLEDSRLLTAHMPDVGVPLRLNENWGQIYDLTNESASQ